MKATTWICTLACGLVTVCATAAQVEEARVSNLAVRAQGGGDTPLIAGFTLGPGPAKTVLVRAVGPSLEALGIDGTLLDPKLAVFDASGARVAENDDFAASDATTFAAVGAFPLRSGGKDAALVATLPPGSYTAQVTGGTAGSTLLEVYDVSGGSARMVNLSTRTTAGRAGGNVIAGITVAPGAGPRRVLVRAIGPTLIGFGLGGYDVLDDPKIEVFSDVQRVAANDNWSTPSGAGAADSDVLSAAFAGTGAFLLGARSRDAALLIDLAPGGYTIQVAGADGGGGQVLVEIYEVGAAPGPTPDKSRGRLTVQNLFFTGNEYSAVRGGPVTGYFLYPTVSFAEITGRSSVKILDVVILNQENGIQIRNLVTFGRGALIPAGGTQVLTSNSYTDEVYVPVADTSMVTLVVTYTNEDGQVATATGSARGLPVNLLPR